MKDGGEGGDGRVEEIMKWVRPSFLSIRPEQQGGPPVLNESVRPTGGQCAQGPWRRGDRYCVVVDGTRTSVT